MPESDLLLPDKSCLLHIGPHKTGTTAIQGALRDARKPMRRHGVVYPGKYRQHQFPALAVTGGKGLAGNPAASMKHWRALVRQVNRAQDKRVIVSSEFFDEADEATARLVVEALGGPRTHVLVTLRPLAQILPSAWQQYVRNRLRAPYDEWLDAMFNRPPYQQPTVTFWKRHHHEVIVQRWVSVVGPENLTVFVHDGTDRLALMRLVESLVGLPQGMLRPEIGHMNRSLTYGETELVRHLNIEFKERGWSPQMYSRYIRRGMVRHLLYTHEPGPDEMLIPTPDWALDRAAEIGAASANAIAQTGARIIGDLSVLGTRPPASAEVNGKLPAAVLPSEAVMKAVTGRILAEADRVPVERLVGSAIEIARAKRDARSGARASARHGAGGRARSDARSDARGDARGAGEHGAKAASGAGAAAETDAS